jgi:hypothetical protein
MTRRRKSVRQPIENGLHLGISVASRAKIVGVRLSFSMDAKALITAQRSKQWPFAGLQDHLRGIALH